MEEWQNSRGTDSMAAELSNRVERIEISVGKRGHEQWVQFERDQSEIAETENGDTSPPGFVGETAFDPRSSKVAVPSISHSGNRLFWMEELMVRKDVD